MRCSLQMRRILTPSCTGACGWSDRANMLGKLGMRPGRTDALSSPVVAMDDPQRPPTPPDRDDDYEPVARWENEGGAYVERDAQARDGPAVTATQDGHPPDRL